ncbi:MAG: hypothetical protein DMF86_13190 [Acidobacteria bacterium]|nr:MAG: hypothetical protein DMF86_13190 [Acidobacteriota bacterium]
MPESLDLAPRRGRPRKFGSPARAVTLTLPEDVLAALGGIDHDLSRAVVRLMQPEMAKKPHPPAELATFGRRAVIVVNPSRTLETRTGILLVPLSDGRALISFDESVSPAGLELTIQDALEDHRLTAEDARVFESIAGILKKARRAPEIDLRQHHIIVLESTRRAPHRGAVSKRRRRNA